MATMIVVTSRTSRRSSVRNERAHQTVSVVLIIDAYRPPGTATAMMIAVTRPTNPKTIASRRNEHALVIFSPATMATAYQGFTSAMVIMIVSIIRTKMPDTSATRANVILIASSPAPPTRTGAALSAFPRDGSAMVIPIVSMVPTRMSPCTRAHHPSHVRPISLDAKTIDASARNGCVVSVCLHFDG